MKKHLEAHSRFLHEYGSDGYMIIAAYEETCGVRQDGRYADWFGDLGLFEASGNEEATYEKLCERYAAGLKYLGIIREQADAVCRAFVSSQLAEHIREEMERSAADSGYMPRSVLSKRHVFELTAEQLAVDAEMDVDCDIGQEITAYIATWFDVDKKFGLDITDEDGTWLNLYAKYNPFADTLRLECEISRDNGSVYFDYEPTPAEARLIKDMIAEKIMQVHGQMPQEFCSGFSQDEKSVYVYINTAGSSMEQSEKRKRLKAYCAEKGYWKGGSVSISVPMYRCGTEFRFMIDYCRIRGISKILVDSMQDIGNTPDEVTKTIDALCSRGFTVEAAKSQQVFAAQNEEASLTMGGLT